MNNNTTQSAFFGLMSNARSILRFSLMSQFKDELLSTHCYESAVIGFMLGSIAADVYQEDVVPERVSTLGTFHECGEMEGGDPPKTAKYLSPEILAIFRKLEHHYEEKLINTLPEAMRHRFRPLIHQDKSCRHVQLAKFADIICAFNKCEFELSKHNYEFAEAHQSTKNELTEIARTEKVVKYYLETFQELSNASIDTKVNLQKQM